MDSLDLKILNTLQDKGRTKRNVLAEEVGLSLPSLSERLRKLEEKGVIEGYHARLNKKFFGFDIMAFILVFMDSSKNFDKLLENVEKTPEILECHAILGDGSHILKAVSKNTAALEALLGEIQSWPGVKRTNTSFVLSTIKDSTKLPL